MSPQTNRTALLMVALALVGASCGDDTAATTTTESTTTTSTTVPAPTTTTEGTTTTTLPASPVLATEGDRNETVLAVQFLLECTNYASLTVDGNFGPATTTAVEAAQTGLGFPVTGEPTEDLFAALNAICHAKRPIEAAEEAIRVVGNTAVRVADEFEISLLFGSTLTVSVVSGEDLIVTVWDAGGTPLEAEDGITFTILESGDYTIEVNTTGEPTMFTIEVGLATIGEAGDWIITTDGIAYQDTEFVLGTAAEPMIEKIFEFLGHGVRGDFDEFDTGWDDPGQEGFRGILIEGIAFLFSGPNDDNPDRAETFVRVRYVGPSFDAEGNPRPAGYVQTLSGITVGHTLEDLKETYGTGVSPGSNSEEHYYRYGSADGGEVCFYFGENEPTDSARILEISTECRG